MCVRGGSFEPCAPWIRRGAGTCNIQTYSSHSVSSPRVRFSPEPAVFSQNNSTRGIEARTKDTNPTYPHLPKNYLSFTFLTTAHHSPSLPLPSPPSHCPVKPLGNLQTSVRLSDCSRNLRLVAPKTLAKEGQSSQ